jgi:hypothetical protein
VRGDDGEGADRAVLPFIRPRRSSERPLGTDEALARLKVAIELRDQLAAERILRAVAGSPDGEWLLRVCFGVAIQRVGREVVDSADS